MNVNQLEAASDQDDETILEPKVRSTALISSVNINEGSVLAINQPKNYHTDSDKSDYDEHNDCRTPVQYKKRVHALEDSGSESERTSKHSELSPTKHTEIRESELSSGDANFNKVSHKSRIRKVSSSSDLCSSSNETRNTIKYEEQERIKNKRLNLKQKFKSFLTLRMRETEAVNIKEPETESQHTLEKRSGVSSESSCDEEETSINRIRQMIKERNIHLKSTIYDPDTSDEEQSSPKPVPKHKKRLKSTILTSPKPIRISAKQAVENMQKIKSESNRMLREKDVSLPYHRPKALSLKDIMSRRRMAVSSDGKALPIKMNEDQLKQYALQLEERQKEMMELCKSESEDEAQETEAKPAEATDRAAVVELNDSLYDDVNKTSTEAQTYRLEKPCDETTKVLNSLENMEVDELNEVQSKSNLDQDKDAATYSNIQIDEMKESVTLTENEKTGQKDLNSNQEGNSCSGISVVYYDSAEDDVNIASKNTEVNISNNLDNINNAKHVIGAEPESQLISLHYDTEKFSEEVEKEEVDKSSNETTVTIEMKDCNNEKNDYSSDDDVFMEDIDKVIENAEIIVQGGDTVNSPMLIKELNILKCKPKLMGAPGTVIDLDGTDPFAPKKLSGVELLKQRFTYFSRVKTPEELERLKEKRIKPGTQHLKLKQELEEKIAEKRSLEWAKRLENEKQQQNELNVIKDGGSDAEDDIDKIEAKIEEVENEKSSSEEELEENDVDIKDKPVKRNPMITDEAEESDCEDIDKQDKENETDDENEDVNDEEDESEETSDEELESENQQTKSKSGRILKAFEDSDDEDKEVGVTHEEAIKDCNNKSTIQSSNLQNSSAESHSEKTVNSQDIEIPAAQRHKSYSDDLFTSQESALTATFDKNKIANFSDDKELGTQSFSIMDSAKRDYGKDFPDKLTTMPYNDNVDQVLGFSQNLVSSQIPPTLTSQSQELGEDILALCTGKFYDNQFISQLDSHDGSILHDTSSISKIDEILISQGLDLKMINEKAPEDNTNSLSNDDKINKNNNAKETRAKNFEIKQNEVSVLKSILDELDEPGPLKENRFFVDNTQNKENKAIVANSLMKKRCVIESDDEDGAAVDVQTKIKLKRKKVQDRALQISDDEKENEEEHDEDLRSEEYGSEIEDEEIGIEYDSDENEVIATENPKKKSHKLGEFFEREAELTSEDEWAGSGDEDEAGLDRMEREQGDDDTFNQGRLQRELGQIHMRDVLDQDKREVRLIQELLLEDGDLGAGSRQRKFRWKNADGEDETGTAGDELADTQEEEFESEEQWRKQRHEREMFLKQMQQPREPEEIVNISINRTTIIKANLSSKSMSTLLSEVNTSAVDNETLAPAKKTAKELPSPVKKPFSIIKRNYHGSLLSRGDGALARLAALATPLVNDDDGDAVVGARAASGKRNFVFAAVTPQVGKPKVTKRKAEISISTPKLVKKMKIEEKQKTRNSLLDHLKT